MLFREIKKVEPRALLTHMHVELKPEEKVWILYVVLLYGIFKEWFWNTRSSVTVEKNKLDTKQTLPP
mgnify:CR=1 FL=1